MKFDIFFSISQTVVNGIKPSEQELFRNFFDQVIEADRLGYNTAWFAESHLSSEVQKENPFPVIPNFKGEVGINVDFFQTASRVFSQTKQINAGSAIMNILCNGGPIAAAERLRSFLSFHQLNPGESRKIELGFASGRFPYINKPYGIVPKTDVEKAAWGPVIVNIIFKQAAEIFIRLVKGEVLSSDDTWNPVLKRSDFRNEEDWLKTLNIYGEDVEEIPLDKHYIFDKLQIVPREVDLKKHLNLIIGSHDPRMHEFVNKLYPVGVFNLSITSNDIVDKTNEKMKEIYNNNGGNWSRDKMPRTVLIFVNSDEGASQEERIKRAQAKANATLAEYWKALEGTLDPEKVRKAENNALIGDPETIIRQMRERFDVNDRLMLWFDFHNHDSEDVKKSMRIFMNDIAKEFH